MANLLVRRGDDRILFDCGEGTQRRLVASVGVVEMSKIFLTQYHAEHWLGLVGMTKDPRSARPGGPLAIHLAARLEPGQPRAPEAEIVAFAPIV